MKSARTARWQLIPQLREFRNCGLQGKEEVFDFLESVLSEVMDLFPSQYIHIGGDEVCLPVSPTTLLA